MSRKSAAMESKISPTTPVDGDEPTLAERKRIVDLAVRKARRSGYCGVFDEMARDMFPDMVAEGNRVEDSDGRTCSEDEWRDADGFDRNGINAAGFNRDGWDKDGFNAAGVNADGVDRDGFTADDPARFIRNLFGRTHEEEAERHGPYEYARDGYDVNGYNRSGYDRSGQYNSRYSRY